MTDTVNSQIFTLAIGQRDGKNTICAISSVLPGGTHIHWFDPVAARQFATNLLDLTDFVDPPQPQWQVVDDKMVDSLQEKAAMVLKHAESAAAVLREKRKPGVRKSKKSR